MKGMLTATRMKAAIIRESLTGMGSIHGVITANGMKENGTWGRNKAKESGRMLMETAT